MPLILTFPKNWNSKVPNFLSSLKFLILSYSLFLPGIVFAQFSPPQIGVSESANFHADFTGIPSTSRIVFTSFPSDSGNSPLGDGDYEIFVMDEDGGNLTQVTDGEARIYEHTAVSFDHKKIAATYRDTRDSVVSKILIFDLVNNTKAQLVPDFFSSGNGGIVWDPDGFLYFSTETIKREQFGGGAQVAKIKSDGTELSFLTHARFGVVDVGISQDGTLLAYLNVDVDPDKSLSFLTLRVMNTDGSNNRLVYDGGSIPADFTDTVVGARDPTPSPDKTQVLFTIENPNYRNSVKAPKFSQTQNLYIIDIDGSTLTQVTKEGVTSHVVPDWRDSKIVYHELDFEDKYYGITVFDPSNNSPVGANNDRVGVGRFPLWIPPLTN